MLKKANLATSTPIPTYVLCLPKTHTYKPTADSPWNYNLQMHTTYHRGCITEVFTYGVIFWCKTVYKYDFKFDVHHKMFVKVLLAPHCVSHILTHVLARFYFWKTKSAMLTPMDCLIRQTAPPIIEVCSHLQGVSEVGFQVALLGFIICDLM